MRENEQLRLCANEQTMEGCELECMSVLHKCGEKKLCVSDGSHFSPAIVKSTRVEYACG